MFRQAIVLALVVGFVGVGLLTAQEAEKKAAAAPKAPAPAAVAAKATAVSVIGTAHKRSTAAADSKWEPLKTGDVLGEQTLIRTGLGTTVVLNFAGRGRVTVRSGTKIGIGELKQRGKLMKARLGLKYGTVRASVDAAAGPNDLQISTAVATLSVRGTILNTRLTERGQDVCLPEGWVKYRTNRFRCTTEVGHRECTNSRLEAWRQLAHQENHTAWRPRDGGQTDEEALAQVLNGGGRAFGGPFFSSLDSLLGPPDSHRNGESNGEYECTSPGLKRGPSSDD